MCGRYGLRTDPRRFVERYLHGRAAQNYAFEPHSNIAPTQEVLTVPNTAERELTSMRWSLIPRYSREPGGTRMATFNARLETLSTSKLFGPLLKSRRAVVPADGYYEWRRNPDGSKTPVWIHRRDGAPIVFAALWDRWYPGREAPPVLSMTIVTKPPIEELAAVHDRMPVVLDLERAQAWLTQEPIEANAALDLLLPDEPHALAYHPVSKRVGNVNNDDADLSAPVDVREPEREPERSPARRARAPKPEQPRLF